MTYTAYREVSVMDGDACLASFEARYLFTVTPGRPAQTWANADAGFQPAEGPTVTVIEVATRWHPSQPWAPVAGQAWDMLTADVSEKWFMSQIEGAAP